MSMRFPTRQTNGMLLLGSDKFEREETMLNSSHDEAAISRRAVMSAAAAALGSMMLPSSARSAADYPASPIRFISPYSTGGGNDLSARIMAAALGPRLGQPIVVENRTGAAGIIGCDYVAKAAADGYTLLWASVDNLTIVPALKIDTPYRIPTDFSYIARIAENGVSYCISSKLPVKTMEEFITYAKANTDKVRFGSAGIGGAPHLATELFMKQTGVKMRHIPYRGISNAMTDLLGGQIEFVALTPITVAGYVNSDKLRIIGYSGASRHSLIPNIPTITELGFPLATFMVWYSLVGPAKMPETIVARLRKEIEGVLADTALKESMDKAGLAIAPIYGDAFQKSVVEELEQWKAIGKAENIVLQD